MTLVSLVPIELNSRYLLVEEAFAVWPACSPELLLCPGVEKKDKSDVCGLVVIYLTRNYLKSFKL